MRVILLGPPGAGKGTLGRQLASRLEASFLSAGEMLWAEARRASPAGEAIRRSRLADGQGVDPDIPYRLLEDTLGKLPPRAAIILDGFPRQANQVSRLDSLLGHPPDLVIALGCPPGIGARRVLWRLTCVACGAPFGPKVPPRKTGSCDTCEGRLERRKDDSHRALATRIAFWERHAGPIERIYSERGVLVEVDATGTPAGVLDRTVRVLGRRRPPSVLPVRAALEPPDRQDVSEL